MTTQLDRNEGNESWFAAKLRRLPVLLAASTPAGCLVVMSREAALLARRPRVGSANMVKHIGIVLFPEVEELDAIGPWEVLSAWTLQFPEDGYAVVCLSRLGGLVQCAKGLVVQAHHSFDDAPPFEVLIYPGGQGTRSQLDDDGQLAWLRRQRAAVPLMTSACTGSLVYAAAGVLEGRPATTHWAALDQLAELDPTIEVRRDERFVDDGDVITAAGVSAGIDMALHLIVRLAGADRARQVRRCIQYDPAPPV